MWGPSSSFAPLPSYFASIASSDTSNVPPPRSKIRMIFSPPFWSRPYAMAGLMIRIIFSPAITPASFVAWRCESLKYAGVVIHFLVWVRLHLWQHNRRNLLGREWRLALVNETSICVISLLYSNSRWMDTREGDRALNRQKGVSFLHFTWIRYEMGYYSNFMFCFALIICIFHMRQRR